MKGDCLSPEITEGDELVFDRDAPLARGDLAAFYFRPEYMSPDGLQISCKRLVLLPPPWVRFPYNESPESNVSAVIMATQTNPRIVYAIRCDHLLGVHKCLGHAGDLGLETYRPEPLS